MSLDATAAALTERLLRAAARCATSPNTEESGGPSVAPNHALPRQRKIPVPAQECRIQPKRKEPATKAFPSLCSGRLPRRAPFTSLNKSLLTCGRFQRSNPSVRRARFSQQSGKYLWYFENSLVIQACDIRSKFRKSSRLQQLPHARNNLSKVV
jgi:hypothetical protein